MREGDHGKFAAAAQRQRKAANNGEEVVAAVLAALEAAVGGGPHAVDAVGAVWFGQYILKGHLKQSTRRVKGGHPCRLAAFVIVIFLFNASLKSVWGSLLMDL